MNKIAEIKNLNLYLYKDEDEGEIGDEDEDKCYVFTDMGSHKNV